MSACALVLVAILAALACSRTARADSLEASDRDAETVERAPRFPHRWVNAEIRLGLGTSVGFIGAVGEVTPFDELAVGGGGGVNAWGGVWNVHVRFRLTEWPSRSRTRMNAIAVELGATHGRYGSLRAFDVFSALCEDSPDNPQGGCYRPRIAPLEVTWAEVEVGWEFRYRSGMTVRPFVGGAVLLAEPDWQCSVQGAPSPCADAAPPSATLVMGVAIGSSFGG